MAIWLSFSAMVKTLDDDELVEGRRPLGEG
jgi:hypothetical protein